MGFFDEYVNEGGGENSYIKSEEKLAIAQSGIPFEVLEVLDEDDNVFEGKKQPRYVLVISLPNPATGEEESRKLAFPKASGVEPFTTTPAVVRRSRTFGSAMISSSSLLSVARTAGGVPCGRVMGLAEVFADPQVRDQEMVLTQHHPGHGDVKMLGFPVKFAAAPCRLRRPAPEIGADTDAVLAGLGYSADDIARLRRAKVI